MTFQQAQSRAASLGLSAWEAQAIAVGKTSRTVEVMCVGFESIELVLFEGSSWDEAFDRAARLIFSD